MHRDVEQVAFSPGSIVLDIEDSPDPLLQFGMFFYRDAQYHRIGVNLHQVPVNCLFVAGNYASLNFDGQMRVDANHAGKRQYVPIASKTPSDQMQLRLLILWPTMSSRASPTMRMRGRSQNLRRLQSFTRE